MTSLALAWLIRNHAVHERDFDCRFPRSSQNHDSFTPKICLFGEGLIESHALCTLVVPLASSSSVKISVEGRTEESQGVIVPWEPGSLLWVPSRTKMWVAGGDSSRIAYLGICFGDDDTET